VSRIVVQSAVVMICAGIAYALGYVRDAAIAANFGASSATDAYFVAYMVPFTLHKVIISGTLVPAFLPVFVEYIGSSRTDEGWHVANTLGSFLFIGLVLLVVVGELWAPLFVKLMTPGFSNETASLAVDLMRMMFPMVIFIGLAGLTSAILNSFHHFALPAFGPGVLSLAVIASLFLIVPVWGIYGVAAGAVIGMIGQLVIQVPVLLHKGFKHSFSLDYRHPGVQKVVRLCVPLLLYLVVAQTSPFVERISGSMLPSGTISNLTYAMKVNSLPDAIFASSIAVVLYPSLSRCAARRDSQAFRETVSKGIRLTLFLTIPSAIWLIACARPVISLLFEHGRFTSIDTANTSVLLQVYAIGIIPASIGGLLVRSFYSLQDTSTPLISGAFTTIAYVILAFSLTKILLAPGLALSLSIASGISTLLLLWLLHRKAGALDTLSILRLLGKVLVASISMGAICVWITQNLGFFSHAASFSERIMQVAGLLVVGTVSYIAASSVLRIEELTAVLSIVRKRFLRIWPNHA